MLFQNFNSKYDFGVDFEPTPPQNRPKTMHEGVLHRRVHAFGTGFEVGLAQNRLQNHIWS